MKHQLLKHRLRLAVVAMTVAALNAHAHAETAAQALPPKSPAPSLNNKSHHHAAQMNVSAVSQNAAVNTRAGGARETVTLQMGAFTDPNLAYKQAAKASLLGLPSRVVHMKNRNGDTVRVVRSSYRLKQVDAEKIAADLREQEVNVLLMQ